jgi:hypothetical protein
LVGGEESRALKG